MKKKIIAFLEIFLLINTTIALSYIVSQSNIVSAQEEQDSFTPLSIYTCLNSKDGKVCQEYPSTYCNSNCTSPCIPSPSSKTNECRLGTCFNPIEGTCSPRTPKILCPDPGKWFNDPNGNINECKRGCCLIGDQSLFITSAQCAKRGNLSGIRPVFKPEIDTELDCVLTAKKVKEGACVFETEDLTRSCKFTTLQDCLKITNDRNSFKEGFLCSAPELNTTCKRQVRSGCVEGKDEVYWFDSCGNRENIYDSNKEKSWNKGRVLSKEESCSLVAGENWLANQKSCGNCNYLQGSRCGEKTNSERLNDQKQDYVCRSLQCIDKDGKKRTNGESWCIYESDFGLDETKNRAITVVGSRSFKATCNDGEISLESCGDYHNGVCLEEKIKTESGREVSYASCKSNLASTCLNYNLNFEATEENYNEKMSELAEKCQKNPFCFVKEQNFDDKGLHFNFCAQKYPIGFDVQDPQLSSKICSLGNTKCKVVYIKKISGWKCVANCECEDQSFVEKMNDLCISLGDCGTKANAFGIVTINHHWFIDGEKGPSLSKEYISKLQEYAKPKKEKTMKIDNISISDIKGELGIPSDFGKYEEEESSYMPALITGGAGIALLMLPSILGAKATTTLFRGVQPYLGATAGALIGAAITMAFLKLTNVGRGLSSGEKMFLVILGSLTGLSVAVGLTPGLASGPLSSLAPWAPYLVIITLAVFAILFILGVGKKKEKLVEFRCETWQPPLGGNKCNLCGKGDLPCSEYLCKSLGQTCKMVNVNTNQEACIDANPNDVTPPLIRSNPKTLNKGFRYEEETEQGVKLRGPNNCVTALKTVKVGISLNERAQCRYDTNRTSNFEEMTYPISSSLFLNHHEFYVQIPSFNELTGGSFAGPNRITDFNIYIRCRDAVGNENKAEYSVNFCVNPGPDITPPAILERLPDVNDVANNITSKIFTFILDEPSECKWSFRDVSYNLMENNMSCETNPNIIDSIGWSCMSSFPITNQTNTYYVRCLDQPWLEGENYTKRNDNKESYSFTLRKTDPLLITYVSPVNQTIKVGSIPTTIELEAKTQGGIDDTATCYYNYLGFDILFDETGGREHKQVLNQVSSGNIMIPIKCEDSVENIARATASIKINLDRSAPKITRVYADDNYLYLITDENAECRYVNSILQNLVDCDFDFENATQATGDQRIHTIPLNKDITYYIKCKDEFNNSNGACDMLVRQDEFNYDIKSNVMEGE